MPCNYGYTEACACRARGRGSLAEEAGPPLPLTSMACVLLFVMFICIAPIFLTLCCFLLRDQRHTHTHTHTHTHHTPDKIRHDCDTGGARLHFWRQVFASTKQVRTDKCSNNALHPSHMRQPMRETHMPLSPRTSRESLKREFFGWIE